MALEITSNSVVCSKCGLAYGKRKGNFPVCYAMLYKGIQYLPVCRECVDGIYSGYLAQCHNAKDAVRQTCRKLDLYWNEPLFHVVEKQSAARSTMAAYITKINIPSYAGRSYDDTLLEEGTLWNFGKEASAPAEETKEKQEEEVPEASPDDVAFWGPGFTPVMYRDLEQRRQFWMKKLKAQGVEMDVGTEAILRQICVMEITINQDRAAGRSIDKNVNALNSLLGSASLKPAQKKEESNADAALASTPLGVWLYRYEQKRPLPEIDEDMKDVNGIRKYVFTWMGHLCKMLGLKNAYSDLYESEVARLRVERPEYDGDDDEAFMNRLFEEDDNEKESESEDDEN